MKDKLLHFISCLILSIILSILFSSFLIGYAISLSIGILKEYLDKITKKGTPDIEDVFADSLGCLTGSFIAYFLIT